jgi:hypothetical protein
MVTSRRVGLFRRGASRQHGEDCSRAAGKKIGAYSRVISFPHHSASETELRLIQRRSASRSWRRQSVRNSFALEAAAFLK